LFQSFASSFILQSQTIHKYRFFQSLKSPSIISILPGALSVRSFLRQEILSVRRNSSDATCNRMNRNNPSLCHHVFSFESAKKVLQFRRLAPIFWPARCESRFTRAWFYLEFGYRTISPSRATLNRRSGKVVKITWMFETWYPETLAVHSSTTLLCTKIWR